MKKLCLILLSQIITFCSYAQVKINYPAGFHKAEINSAYLKKFLVKDYKRNCFQFADPGNSFMRPAAMISVPYDLTEIIGTTKYDAQTYNSTQNQISYNNDATISVCWNFSPDANYTSIPPYPNRGTGYNYWNSGWAMPTSIGPQTGGIRTNFPNIVVTPIGNELTIQDAAITGTTYNQIVINWRPVKGTGNWTTAISPWNTTSHYQNVKACGGLTNENVYAIWVDMNSSFNTGTLYFSRSTNGGQTWSPESTIPFLNSNYDGFEPDSYSIDARGDTVAISIGYELTDILLLKSFDAGNNWTQTIIQKHPIPHFQTCNCTSNFIVDANPIDTVRANGGDSKVIIDHQGMCHVWFSALDFHSDAGNVFIHYATDNLFYWNENLGEDTTTVWDALTGGNGNYVAVATAEDFNGNGRLDVPSDTFQTCDNFLSWGYYDGGITQMPATGIDIDGNIYVAYQTINELADTTTWHMAHRHIYCVKLQIQPGGIYDPQLFTPPYNIIPSVNQGGDGENEECIFPTMARHVIGNNNWNFSPVIMYQMDQVPGSSILSDSGSCERVKNTNLINLMRIWAIDPFTSVSDISIDQFFIGGCFPNPVSDLTTMEIYAPKSGSFNMKFYDSMGRIVIHTPNENLIAGKNFIPLNCTSLASGIYTGLVSFVNSEKTFRIVVE